MLTTTAETQTGIEGVKSLLSEQLLITDGVSLSVDLLTVLSAATQSPVWKDFPQMKKENLTFQVIQLAELMQKLDGYTNLIHTETESM